MEWGWTSARVQDRVEDTALCRPRGPVHPPSRAPERCAGPGCGSPDAPAESSAAGGVAVKGTLSEESVLCFSARAVPGCRTPSEAEGRPAKTVPVTARSVPPFLSPGKGKTLLFLFILITPENVSATPVAFQDTETLDQRVTMHFLFSGQ